MSAQGARDESLQGVRFSTANEEIPPDDNLDYVETLTGADGDQSDPNAEDDLKQLKTSLQNAHVQSRRMEQYSFEPVSLPGSQPVSRVPSGSMTPSRRLPAGSAAPSPHHSPPTSAPHSPPLTPAVTVKDGKHLTSGPNIAQAQRARAQGNNITPQRSSSPERSARSRPGSSVDATGLPKPTPRFSLGPSGESAPPSEDVSPVTTPGTTTPSGTGSSTNRFPFDQRKPSTQPQDDSIEARFRFGNRDPRHGFSSSGTNLTMPTQSPSGVNLTGDNVGSSSSSINSKSEHKGNNRHSFFGASKHHGSDENMKNDKGSTSNLKRFFKFGGHKKDKKPNSRPASPTRDGPHQSGTNGAIPFADDHGLQSKYGKFGKMLGAGAGGSVRLMKRTGDGKTFAVKQFRSRHAYETEREYNKKVTAEFCIGSTLHHGNIIETIDIVNEKGVWYEVMEYAPFYLFATVMTGKMGRDEVTCCTLQILAGVTYIHSMGLAHRDMKLDNVVINEHGIMKIIDFGSAVVFRYPFEKDIVLATGVVGSDPYLAPEVYDNSRYDPQPADVWSIAIIFCCMCLRRFPWKAPRMSDNSYKLFVSPPDPGQEAMLNPSKSGSRQASTSEESKSGNSSQSQLASVPTVGPNDPAPGNMSATIKGPIRLLRLLPRDSRHIIGRMLELDPKKRATIDEILADNWVQNALVCTQEEGGQCYHAPNHSHALESGGQSVKK